MCAVNGEILCPHYDRNGWHEQSNHRVLARNINEHRLNMAANVATNITTAGYHLAIYLIRYYLPSTQKFITMQTISCSFSDRCENASDQQLGDSCPLSMEIYRKGKR